MNAATKALRARSSPACAARISSRSNAQDRPEALAYVPSTTVTGSGRHDEAGDHYVGLLRALERFDAEQGTPFWAYVT